jgi:hypothetical protein
MADARTKYGFSLEDKALEVRDRWRKLLQGFAASCRLHQSTGEDRDILGIRLACLISAAPALRRSFANPLLPRVEVRVRC